MSVTFRRKKLRGVELTKGEPRAVTLGVVVLRDRILLPRRDIRAVLGAAGPSLPFHQALITYFSLTLNVSMTNFPRKLLHHAVFPFQPWCKTRHILSSDIFTALYALYAFSRAHMGLLNASKKNPREKHTALLHTHAQPHLSELTVAPFNRVQSQL